MTLTYDDFEETFLSEDPPFQIKILRQSNYSFMNNNFEGKL